MTEVKLKPCPFCGGEGWLCPPHRGDKRVVTCRQCGCQTDWLVGLGAVEAWNRRTDNCKNCEALKFAQKWC